MAIAPSREITKRGDQFFLVSKKAIIQHSRMATYSCADLLKAYFAWTATIDRDGYIKNQYDRNDKFWVYCDVRDGLPAGESKRRYLNIKVERYVTPIPFAH